MTFPNRALWCLLITWNIYDLPRDHGWSLFFDLLIIMLGLVFITNKE